MVMSLMVGEWKGEYSSEASGKFGIIEFNLTKGADDAHGQVFMKESLGPHSLQQPLVTTYFRPLAIKFVHAGDEVIHGIVDPYTDLKRNVTVHTSFKGKVIGDVMEGTYISTIEETNQSYIGKWKVTRQ